MVIQHHGGDVSLWAYFGGFNCTWHCSTPFLVGGAGLQSFSLPQGAFLHTHWAHCPQRQGTPFFVRSKSEMPDTEPPYSVSHLEESYQDSICPQLQPRLFLYIRTGQCIQEGLLVPRCRHLPIKDPCSRSLEKLICVYLLMYNFF